MLSVTGCEGFGDRSSFPDGKSQYCVMYDFIKNVTRGKYSNQASFLLLQICSFRRLYYNIACGNDQKETHLVTEKCIGIIYSVVHLFFLQVNYFQGTHTHICICTHLWGPYLLYKLDVVILASVPLTGIHLVGCCALAKGCHISWAEFNFVVHGTFVRWARLCCWINWNHPNVSFIGLNTPSVLCVCMWVCLIFNH